MALYHRLDDSDHDAGGGWDRTGGHKVGALYDGDRNAWDRNYEGRGSGGSGSGGGGEDAYAGYEMRETKTSVGVRTRRKQTDAGFKISSLELGHHAAPPLLPLPASRKKVNPTTAVVAAKPKSETKTQMHEYATVPPETAKKKTKAKKASSKPTNKCVEVTCSKKGCTLWVRSFAVFLCSCFVCCTVQAKPRVRWTPPQVRAVHDLTKGTCYYCGIAFRTDVDPTVRLGVWQMDHFFPISQHEELDVIENIVPSCITCNSVKHAQSPFAFAETQHRRLRCQHVHAGRMCLREVTRYIAHKPPFCFDHLVT